MYMYMLYVLHEEFISLAISLYMSRHNYLFVLQNGFDITELFCIKIISTHVTGIITNPWRINCCKFKYLNLMYVM